MLVGVTWGFKNKALSFFVVVINKEGSEKSRKWRSPLGGDICVSKGQCHFCLVFDKKCMHALHNITFFVIKFLFLFVEDGS